MLFEQIHRVRTIHTHKNIVSTHKASAQLMSKKKHKQKKKQQKKKSGGTMNKQQTIKMPTNSKKKKKKNTHTLHCNKYLHYETKTKFLFKQNFPGVRADIKKAQGNRGKKRKNKELEILWAYQHVCLGHVEREFWHFIVNICTLAVISFLMFSNFTTKSDGKLAPKDAVWRQLHSFSRILNLK